MKLIITDGATLNPGDLDWSPLNQFGEVNYFGTTTPSEAVTRCRDMDIIISNKTIIDANTINSAAQLKMIAVTATGYNNIDIKAANDKGVVVCNVPEYSTFSVAQHAFAMLLELMNHVGLNSAAARNDGWSAENVWSFTRRPIHELKDKTLGIVGLGRIGKQTATLGRAFGMKIIFHNRSRKQFDGGTQVELPELFTQSDVISLHCPLTAENKGIVALPLLTRMKRTAILINTSRGPLINEVDLASALDQDMLAAAALDVLSEEPPQRGHALTHHPRCLVTAHNAWGSVEARGRLLHETVENITHFIVGRPRNIVR